MIFTHLTLFNFFNGASEVVAPVTESYRRQVFKRSRVTRHYDVGSRVTQTLKVSSRVSREYDLESDM